MHPCMHAYMCPCMRVLVWGGVGCALAGRSVHRYALRAESGEEAVVTVTLALQESLDSQ